MKKTYDDGVTVYNYGIGPTDILTDIYISEKRKFLEWLEDALNDAKKDDWVMAMNAIGNSLYHGSHAHSLVKYAGPTKETGPNKPIPDDQEHR